MYIYGIGGGLLYFIGTFAFQKKNNGQMTIIGAILYSFGGLCFLLCGLEIRKSYFDSDRKEEKIEESDAEMVE